MEKERVEGLKDRLVGLREQGEALRRAAADIPSMERNCQRLLASLKMMEIDMGMLTVPDFE